MFPYKKLALFGGFFLLFGCNMLLMVNLWTRAHIKAQQEKILSELPSNIDNKQKYPLSSAPLVLGAVESNIVIDDGRAANLRNFFRRYNSPLYDYADVIIQTSDKHNLDYRILPAIAMQESQGCLKIPPGSNNCWGWGVYGNQALAFSSYEEAIETVAAGIKRNYVDSGLLTPEAVMSKYTPSSNGSWANAITYFFGILD